MATNIGSSLCECLELASQGTIDRMVNRIAKASRDRVNLNSRLQAASSTIGTELSDLTSTLNNVLDFESSVTAQAEQGFSFPSEGGISFGEVSRCINRQINSALTSSLGNFNSIALDFCSFNKAANLLTTLVDEINPRLDAQLSFGCNPNTVAGLQASVSNTLGIIGADQSGRVDISSLTSESLSIIGTSYYNSFNSLVRCCLNIDGITSNIKSFITNPFTGSAFNPVSFVSSLDLL